MRRDGTIVAVYSADGTKLLSYTYDAFGNKTTKYLATDTGGGVSTNYIGYRGYYYDFDLGLYFTQTRLYDPTTGRFISADSYVSTGQGMLGNHMYTYSGNSPVHHTYTVGQPWLVSWIGTNVTATAQKPPTSNVGAAKRYVLVPGGRYGTSPNCYGYAIGSPFNEQPGAASGRIPTADNDVYDVGASVVADLIAMGYTVRSISGPYDKLYDNEFKIALRVGTEPYNRRYEEINWQPRYDYHFMVQTGTGQWAEKHAYDGDSILWAPGMTPETIPWTLYGLPYYDSPILYFAISR